MRKELEEIRRIEKHLLGKPVQSHQEGPSSFLGFKFQQNVLYQKIAYRLIQEIGRKQVREELETIFQELMTSPNKQSFQQKIRAIFLKK